VVLLPFSSSSSDVFSTMKYLLLAAAAVQSALAHPGSHPDAQGRYTIEAEGIKAQFIPYAATLTNLFVKGEAPLTCVSTPTDRDTDSKGKALDIVLGYDNTSFYGKRSMRPDQAPSDMAQPLTLAIPFIMQFLVDMSTALEMRSTRLTTSRTIQSETMDRILCIAERIIGPTECGM
jgi:hypothetical protein